MTRTIPDEAMRATRELGGRHVLVTGASRGIGAAIAAELAHCGARVSLVGRSLERAEAVRERLDHPEVHAAFAADVTSEEEVGAMVRAAQERLGPVFALVNNAGGGEAAEFLDAETSHWRRMIDVNLMGAVFCTRSVLGAMRERHEGRVINIGSTASVRGFRHVSAYAAAKHALLGLTRSLALEVARDAVVVSAVCPGYTETEMLAGSVRAAAARTGRSEAEIRSRFESGNRGGRLVQPAEVARVVAWLCGDDAAGMSGRYVLIEGGPPEVCE
jgi:NAD(P)-dependent dehydrogenase (short-subunit alcohol dehydrogenase family)